MASVVVTNTTGGQVAVGNFIIQSGQSKTFEHADFQPWVKGLPSSLSADIQALDAAGLVSVSVDGVAASGDTLGELDFAVTKPTIRLTASIVAGTSDEGLLFTATEDLVVQSVEFVPDQAVTANDTNYANLSVENKTAGSQVAANDTTTADTDDLVAFTGFDLTLIDAIVAAGDVLTGFIDKQGTGVVISGTYVLTATPAGS